MNIIITGASGGIGYHTALRLSTDESNTVIAISRNIERLQQLKKESLDKNPFSSLRIIPFDLEDGSYLEDLLPQILKEFTIVDVLINNAGALINKPFESLHEADWEKMFFVNVMAPVKLIQLLLPYMGNFNRSHIVNIGSMGGFQGSAKFAGLSAYSSSKAMLSTVSECLAEEFKEKNIHVNCLALGAAQTEMLSQAFPGYKAPLSAQEISEFIADFSLKAHHFMNGKIIPVSLSTP